MNGNLSSATSDKNYDMPLLSLCIPTNGIIELIFPVLDSIYSQQVQQNLFEVVVMDNGDNEKFQSMIADYAKKHSNLHYYHTDKKLFLNEPESYKAAKGEFIKFVNHRTKLVPGALQYFIDFVNANIEEKPFVYFLDGQNVGWSSGQTVQIYDSFDEFVVGLSYWSSWSTGMGFWKSDFDQLADDVKYNTLFPHTTILFSQRHKSKYIIDNTLLLDEIKINHAKKGSYDVYYAFAVEYVSILLELVRDGDLKINSFLKLKDENLESLVGLYLKFNIKKEPHSYDLRSFKEAISVYYSKSQFFKKVVRKACKKCKKILFPHFQTD